MTLKSLPEDLIILILVTLPVKTLMRFRCVCKCWYDLIRSPKFIEMHSLYAKHKKDECILIQRFNTYYETVLSFLSYESLNVISPNLKIPQLNSDSDNRIFKVSNPCNGLLLLVSNDTRTLILCNPATREFKLLPHPIPYPDRKNYMWVYKLGLGFDSKKDEYKAFVEIYNEDDASLESLVYNLSTNSWRQIKLDERDRYSENTQGVPFNGALHWIVKRHRIVERDVIDIIVCFDLSTEVLQDIELPQAILSYKCDHKNLTIVNDCLALFTFSVYYIDLESKYVDIWVMKEYGVMESWTKLFSISGIQNTYIWWYPRLLWKNEAILIETRICKEKRKLVSCALDTHHMTDTRLMNDYELQQVMVYKESLVSIK